MAKLTAFSFGYEGWGPHTRTLIDALDLVEASRGFAPPLLVDIRIRREVRAVGFRGNALAELIGERYVWMPKLGNRGIVTGKDGIEIADPTAAETLLELVIQAHAERRRVVFFCSCGPVVGCHRQDVGDLLLAAAKRANQDLEVIEWPGEAPRTIQLPVSAETLHQVARGRKWIPMMGSVPQLFGTPWFSKAILTANGDSLEVLTGPAAFSADGWKLPVLGLKPSTCPHPDELRISAGLAGKNSRSLNQNFPEPKYTGQVHPYCVYHIRNSGLLADIVDRGGADILSEKGDWRRVAATLEEAKLLGDRMLIVFDNAEEFVGVNWVGQLDEVKLEEVGDGRCPAKLKISGLRQLPEAERFPITHLRLKRGGKRVKPGYLHGCLLCYTPESLMSNQGRDA